MPSYLRVLPCALRSVALCACLLALLPCAPVRAQEPADPAGGAGGATKDDGEEAKTKSDESKTEAKNLRGAPRAGDSADEALARRLVFEAGPDSEVSDKTVLNELNKLDLSTLERLRIIIKRAINEAWDMGGKRLERGDRPATPEEMQAEDELIVSSYWPYMRRAIWLRSHIEDRLGCLRCEVTVRGKFLEQTLATSSLFYAFKTSSGKIIEVRLSDATLDEAEWPDGSSPHPYVLCLTYMADSPGKSPWYDIVKMSYPKGYAPKKAP